jgi:Na+-driven multidrug efflux pump
MNEKNRAVFEQMPVLPALLKFALPSIIGMLVTMVYSLADSYFIGKTNNAAQLSAIALTYVLLLMTNALASLFGVGGGSLISRLLGRRQPEEAKKVCAVSFYGTITVALVYSICCHIFMDPLLRFIGATDSTIGYAANFTEWVVVVGAIPMTLNMTMSQLLRNEGYANQASAGLIMSALFNIALDPLFMFVILPAGHEVTGAGMATLLANVITLCYFLIMFFRLRKNTSLSLSPRLVPLGLRYLGPILSVGFPSAIGTLLASFANIVSNSLTAGYGDAPLAAMGLVKKIVMLPMNIGMGLCMGMLPLVSYNYSAKNYKRMQSFISSTLLIGMIFSALCILIFEVFAGGVMGLFTQESQVVALSTDFLRINILVAPFLILNLQIRFTLQAMGKGTQSLILSVCRQAMINIPLTFLLNRICGVYGIAWAQVIANVITLFLSFGIYHSVTRKLLPAKQP